MALVLADVHLWRNLKAMNVIPPTPRVLEIGEANWFCDSPAADVPEISRHCPQLLSEEINTEDPFQLAKAFYRSVLNYRTLISVDMDGGPTAVKADLNQPLPLSGMFDVIINSGTAEHIFDQKQLFESIHSLCQVGGLMVHVAPWQGWTDHGFYCYQPTFWKDMAAANEYETLVIFSYNFRDQIVRDDCSPDEIREDTLIYVAFRKTAAKAFRVPWQGRYSRSAVNL